MRKIILTAYICCLLISCDLRHQAIDLPYDDEPSKLCMDAILSTTDTITVSVYLSGTLREYRDLINSELYQPSSIKVTAYEDSIWLDTLSRTKLPNNCCYFNWKSLSGKKPQAGHSYYFVVSADGFETIYNTPVRVPEPVPLNPNITIVDSIGVYEGDGGPDVNQIISSLSFTFNDPANQSNYYSFYVAAYNADSIDLGLSANIDNIMGCKSSGWKPTFSDVCFDGKTVQVNIPVRSFYGNFKLRDAAYLTIGIVNLSYEDYLFWETYVDQPVDVEDAIFREPYNTYSNVQNGYGIVSTSSVSTLTIQP